MPHNHVQVSQSGYQGLRHQHHDHMTVHRLNESRPTDRPRYLMAAFFEVHVGEPIPVLYAGPGVVYVVEGEFNAEERDKPGELIKVVAGDVIHFDEGTHLTCTSPAKGKGFAVTYAPCDMHPEDLVLEK